MVAPKKALDSQAAVTTAPRFVEAHEADALRETIQDRISKRAYQLYEQSGYQQGQDRQNWLQAESEVLGHGLEVRESGSWIAVNGRLPAVSAEDVQIYIDPRRVIVRAKTQDPLGGHRQSAANEEDVFVVADLNTEVEPESASAALKDEKLSLMIKKCRPAKLRPIEFSPDS